MDIRILPEPILNCVKRASYQKGGLGTLCDLPVQHAAVAKARLSQIIKEVGGEKKYLELLEKGTDNRIPEIHQLMDTIKRGTTGFLA